MGYRILLADDSLTIQKVVELVFAGSEWDLRIVGSGDKAAALLPDFAPDVVLADAVMPGLTGYEICEAVKRLEDGPYIPVILLTGTFEPFDRTRAQQAGADSVVTKPFDSHALVTLVRDLTEKAKEAKAAAPPPPPPPAPEPEPVPPPSEVGEDTAPTDVGRLMRERTPEPEGVPDALYATSAIPVFPQEQGGVAAPPAVPSPEPQPEPTPEAVPAVPPEPFRDALSGYTTSAAAYEVDLGGLEEDVSRRDIEADIAEFERSGRVSAAVPAFSTVPAGTEAETGPVELPPHGGPLPEPTPSDLELLASRASLGDLTRLVGAGGEAPHRPLGDDEVERIARRVVEILGERVVRKVAWDVVPEMAERLVRERLRELERTD